MQASRVAGAKPRLGVQKAAVRARRGFGPPASGLLLPSGFGPRSTKPHRKLDWTYLTMDPTEGRRGFDELAERVLQAA